MEIAVKLQIIYKDTDIYQLQVQAWNGYFCGTVEIYAGIGDIEKMAQALQGFPNSPSDHRELVLGTFDPKFAGGGVAMRFHCTGGAGHSHVEVRMDSGFESAGTVQNTLLSLAIAAVGVDSFVQGLRTLELRSEGSAILPGVLWR
jgi:hypothetical protein